MRFYFQDRGQKVATKCIRVASDATVSDVIGESWQLNWVDSSRSFAHSRYVNFIFAPTETLIEKFRPDMRMLSVPSYALYEVHSNGEERKLNADEKPLLVQLNWHIDDREGRFLLRNTDQKGAALVENVDTNFKRKLSKREKKEQKKKEKLAKLNSNPSGDAENNHVAEKLYTELPETSFTRSISNPEAVMRRRRQQILEKKLQQFRAKDGGPDTGMWQHVTNKSIWTLRIRRLSIYNLLVIFCFRRRNTENLWWKSMPWCAVQNTIAVDTWLRPGGRTWNAGQIWFGQGRSAALLSGAGEQRRYRIHSRWRRMPIIDSDESSDIKRFVNLLIIKIRAHSNGIYKIYIAVSHKCWLSEERKKKTNSYMQIEFLRALQISIYSWRRCRSLVA